MSKLTLERAKALSVIVATLFVPIVVAWIGTSATSTWDDQVKLRYLELAIEVLKEPPTQSNVDLRAWAMEVLSESSPTRMDSKTLDNLKLTPLPPTAWYADSVRLDSVEDRYDSIRYY